MQVIDPIHCTWGSMNTISYTHMHTNRVPLSARWINTGTKLMMTCKQWQYTSLLYFAKSIMSKRVASIYYWCLTSSVYSSPQYLFWVATALIKRYWGCLQVIHELLTSDLYSHVKLVVSWTMSVSMHKWAYSWVISVQNPKWQGGNWRRGTITSDWRIYLLYTKGILTTS